MIRTMPFEYVPEEGITRVFHFDDETDTAYIETHQDITAIVEENKALYASIDERTRWSDDICLAARIPIHIYADLKRRGIIDYNDPKQKKFCAWLNDSDNRVFKIRPGRI